MTIGGETRTIGPGAMAFVPPNTVHTFKNIGVTPSKMLDWSLPGGQDHYFQEVDEMGKGGAGFGGANTMVPGPMVRVSLPTVIS